MHTVGRYGGRTGATARAHRDSLLLGIVNEIPDYEIVVHIAHTADDTDLILQPVKIFLRLVGIPLPEAIHTELAEVFLIGIALRHREGRQVIFMEGKLQIAPLGNFCRVIKSFLTAGKQLPQFFFTFQVKFLRLEFHAVGIFHGFSGLDAQQNILHGCILTAQIVGVIGNDHRQPRLPRQPHQALIDSPLLRNTVILHFQVEIIFPKNR